MKLFVLLFLFALGITFNGTPYRSGTYFSLSDTVFHVGDAAVIPGLYFEFNEAPIRQASYGVMDTVAAFLIANDSLTFEVGVHMNPAGKESFNISVSERRALNVYDYLVRNGVSPNRLAHRGYGSAVPLATQCEQEQRAMHRRTELLITGKSFR